MLLVAYDISNDKLRNRFAKLLENFGVRVQYSVFEMKNSERLLGILKSEIEGRFSKLFTGADNVRIYEVNLDKVVFYGNALHSEEDVLFLD